MIKRCHKQRKRGRNVEPREDLSQRENDEGSTKRIERFLTAASLVHTSSLAVKLRPKRDVTDHLSEVAGEIPTMEFKRDAKIYKLSSSLHSLDFSEILSNHFLVPPIYLLFRRFSKLVVNIPI